MKLKFHPRNRYLLVELIEEVEENDSTTILLPEGYKPKEEGIGLARVIDISPDCKVDVKVGNTITIEKHMLTEFKIKGTSFYLILENYILGIVIE